MPRIRIDLPDDLPFSTEIPIYIGHINYANHLDNAALFSLLSEARSRYFNSMGYREGDVEGVGIVVADIAAQYRSEAFHGETLAFSMAANDFNEYGCDLVWKACEKVTGREVARGKVGVVFFDYANRVKARVPEAFIRKAGA